MEFQKLLRLGLIPTYISLILCLLTATLITHYWILGDYFTMAYLTLNAPDQKTTEIFINFLSPATDAAIVSASTALIATIIAIIAWYKLRRWNMDLDLPRRRFWVGCALLTSTANFSSALAALILHYTQRGDDKFGCRTSINKYDITVMSCTREIAACKVLPAFVDLFEPLVEKKWAMKLTCNEAVAVKWLQIVIMLNAIALFGLFAQQAWVRRKTRADRMNAYSKNGSIQDGQAEGYPEWVH